MEAVIERCYNKEKEMSIETKASKLLGRLKQVNPSVTLAIAKQCLNASVDVKLKIIDSYGLNQTASWHDEVKSLLSL